MFDADGCITTQLSKSKGSAKYVYVTPLAAIDIREEVIVDIFLAMFGGRKVIKRKKIANHSTTYYWRATGKSLEKFLTMIEPYLILKKDQAKVIQSFRKIRGSKTSQKITEGEYESMLAHRAEIKRLNRTGVGKEDKFLPANDYLN